VQPLAAAGLIPARLLVVLAAMLFAPAAASGQAGVSYQIPPDNPFVGVPGAAPEVYALGLRNPFRFSFDRLTGDLLIGDVGGGAREEIDWIGAAAARGANFGWPCREGTMAGPRPDMCPVPGAVEPLFDYPTPAPGAVIGGYVVRDPGLTGLYGRYVFADHYSGQILSLALNFASPDDQPTGATEDAIGGFGEDAAGRLYVADLNGNQVLRLAPGSAPGTLQTAPAGVYAAPVAVAPEPGNPARLFVAEIAGKVKLGGVEFLDVAQFPGGLAVGGERGLLSVAAAPDFPLSGRVYVYYTDGGGDIRVEEISRSPVNPSVADPATRRTLLVIEHSEAGNHNGGTLQFGPDRCLWITTGDGGGQADQFNNAQNLGTHKGKVLRINPDPPSRSGPACGSPPAALPIGPAAPADTTAPRLRVRIKRRQRVLRLRGAVARANCNEPCTITARGKLRIARKRFRMLRVSRAARVTRRSRMKVRLTRRGTRALRRALRRKRRASVRIALRATDPAGNRSRLVRGTVRVRR
jgi:glucose/arabinose dehydrogenase